MSSGVPVKPGFRVAARYMVGAVRIIGAALGQCRFSRPTGRSKKSTYDPTEPSALDYQN
jgi:hypothetical protein